MGEWDNGKNVVYSQFWIICSKLGCWLNGLLDFGDMAPWELEISNNCNIAILVDCNIGIFQYWHIAILIYYNFCFTIVRF